MTGASRTETATESPATEYRAEEERAMSRIPPGAVAPHRHRKAAEWQPRKEVRRRAQLFSAGHASMSVVRISETVAWTRTAFPPRTR